MNHPVLLGIAGSFFFCGDFHFESQYGFGGRQLVVELFFAFLVYGAVIVVLVASKRKRGYSR